jgi:3-hydroxyisobutyrate dehydrogenase-like beta-hydroxyacid dehydrogenase
VTTVGVLHPGSMGALVGRALAGKGLRVLWASAGRSAATSRRAADAGLTDAGTLEAVRRESDVIVSVCPPGAAYQVAQGMAGFRGLYVDANCIAPTTARRIADVIESGGGRYADAAIVGATRGRPCLYASGPASAEVNVLFAGSAVEVRVIPGHPMSASALKVCGAAWAKGISSLLLDVRALAVAEGVSGELLREWAEYQPQLEEESRKAAQRALERGWRWTGEMEEIARSFRAFGLPGGFHEAAGRVYASVDRDDEARSEDASVDRVVAALLAHAVPFEQ